MLHGDAEESSLSLTTRVQNQHFPRKTPNDAEEMAVLLTSLNIPLVELYTIGILDKASALGKLSEHQPNHQICILNQEILDKYLKFVNVIEL
jgi:hypothetical protein